MSQKTYTLSEIKELCGRARLTITSITESIVVALNTRNGMQHLFHIKQLDPNDYIKQEPKHIKQVKEELLIEEDKQEETIFEARLTNEKERIIESFKQLNKDNEMIINEVEETTNKDEYVLMSDYDKEINDFAITPTPPTPILVQDTIKIEEKVKTKEEKPKDKKRKGRPKGSTNKAKKKTSKE